MSELLEARRLLNLARAGWDVPDTAITWALIVSGDLISEALPQNAKAANSSR